MRMLSPLPVAGCPIVAAMLLAGCAQLGDAGLRVPTPAAPAVADAPQPAAEAPRVAAVPPPRVRPAMPPREAAPPSGPGAAEIRLVGLDQPATRALLGPPAAISADGAAELWRYRTPSCTLGVYFYFDVEREGFYVLQYDVSHATDGSDSSDGDCLRDVHRGRGDF